MDYFVYILKKQENNFYYKGITSNISKRIKQHENGQTFSTHSIFPFKIIHVEICPNRQTARKLEKYFKSGSGREIIKEIE